MKLLTKIRYFVFVALVSLGSVLTLGSSAAHAYTNSRLMDDQVFDNVGTMNESNIQSFLASKGPCLPNYSDVDPNWNGSSWTYGGSVSAAHIIYKSAQQWGINPQVILATLEKEESLVSGTSCDGWRYNSAMGYACPDSGGCNSHYAGFTRQVLWGSWQLKFGKERSIGNLPWDGDGDITYVGYMTQGTFKRCNACSSNYYDGYATIDGQSVHMDNGTTAALYSYTPHLGQSFPGIFESWFGSTYSQNYSSQLMGVVYGNGNTQIQAADKESIVVTVKNTGTTTWSNSTSPVKLALYGRSSGFYDPTWQSAARVTTLNESSVAPGSNGTFSFTVQAPAAGSYSESFRLVSEGVSWFSNDTLIPFQVNATTFSAQYISDNLPTVLQTNQTGTGTVTYKNTGNTTWYKSGSGPVKLGVYGHGSVYADGSWENSSRAATMNEATVSPGANATFTFTVRGPSTAGNYSDSFEPIVEGWTWISSPFNKAIMVTGTYSANAVSNSNNLTMVAGSTQDLVLSFTNTGTATWSNSSFPILKLATWPYGRSSSFTGDNWLAYNRPSLMNEASVAQNGTATFNLRLKAPAQTGLYNESFTPIAEGMQWVNSPINYNINVVPASYTWQAVSESYTVNGGSPTANTVGSSFAIDPGDVVSMTLTAKNTGNVTWSNTGSFPIKLGLWNGQSSSKLANNWPAANRAAVLNEASVAPGANGTFTISLRAPYPGQFRDYFNLVSEGTAWFNDAGFSLPVGVDGNFAWQVVSQSYTIGGSTTSSANVNMTHGTSATLTVVAKNTGDVTWKNTGSFPIKMATSSPFGRSSSFYANTWPAVDRAAILSEASVAPGANGTFTFAVQAPSTTGTYREYFDLISEGMAWFSDPGMSFYFTVN